MPGEENITAICGQMGGKYPMGFVFTSLSGDFDDLVPYIELDFEGLDAAERMRILEVARQDAEFWARFEKLAYSKLRRPTPYLTSASVDEDNSWKPRETKKRRENDPGNDGETIKEVREHIEIFVSVLLGKSVDSASVGNQYDDPQYVEYVSTFRPLVTRCLSRLSLSVYKAILGESLGVEDLPTSAHALAKTVILEAADAARKLSHMKVSELNCNNDNTILNGVQESYEALLATAVLNTVIEVNQKSKKEFGIQTDAPSAVAGKPSKVDSGVQSDLPFSDSDSDCGTSVLSSSTNPQTNYTESADDFMWQSLLVGTCNEDLNSTLVEEVEEILTLTDEKGESEEVYSGTLEKFLASLGDIQETEEIRLTSFPEHGVDIVEGYSREETRLDSISECSLLERRCAVDNWTENWLFRQRKDSAPSALNFADYDDILTTINDEPLGMFVPLPIEALSPTIGDKDVDMLSELSERNSYGSLEFSPSDSDDEVDDTGQSHESLEQQECETSEQYASLPFRLFSPPTSLISIAQPFSEERDENELKIPNFREPESRPELDKGKVKFSVKPENATVGVGRCLRVRCRPVSATNAAVAWFFQGERIVPNERCKVYEECGTYVAEVYDVSFHDSGKYSVVAYTEDSQMWSDFSVRVIGRRATCSRPSILLDQPTSAVVEGQDARITGEVNGHPEPLLSVSETSVDKKRIKLERLSSNSWVLRVRRICPNDAGSFTLQAINRLGQTSSTVKLIVTPKAEAHCTQSQDDGTPPPLPPKANQASVPKIGLKSGFFPPRSDEIDLIPPVPLKRRNVPRKVVEVLPIPRLRRRSDASQEIKEEPEKPVKFIGLDELLPALPGSIAEREHRKWSHAVPMPNNPYSAESLERRLKSNNHRFDLKDLKSVYNLTLPTEEPVSEKPEPDWLGAYRRDYVIGEEEKSFPQVCWDFEMTFKPTWRVTRGSLNFQTSSLPPVMRVRSYTADGAANVKQSVDPLLRPKEREVVATKNEKVQEKNGGSEKVKQEKTVKNVKDRNKANERMSETEGKETVPSLPSVKQLASLFRTPGSSGLQSQALGSRASTASLNSELDRAEETISVPKFINRSVSEDHLGFNRVYSLTARSVPREFRRCLDLNKQREQDRNIKLPSPVKINPGSAPAEPSKPFVSPEPPLSRKSVKDSIAKRAAFWDNRIVNEIADDALVEDEFPEMSEL